MALHSSRTGRFASQAGNGSGTIIVWVGAASVAIFIFYGIIDWIVSVKNDRVAQREEQAERNGPSKPFVPRAIPGSQVTY
ncbi:MAG: hypothetical protein J0M12_06570 [Deltaproteobacteria bacterium]|nr:hypothetical protein [Deltaproteobacteria bacterium]